MPCPTCGESRKWHTLQAGTGNRPAICHCGKCGTVRKDYGQSFADDGESKEHERYVDIIPELAGDVMGGRLDSVMAKFPGPFTFDPPGTTAPDLLTSKGSCRGEG